VQAEIKKKTAEAEAIEAEVRKKKQEAD